MNLPLDGKRVLVTRAAEDSAELLALLRARGAQPALLPCIAFEDGPDAPRVAEAVARAELVIVSSPHAARRLAALVPELGRARLAAVGEATARALPGEARAPRTGAGAQALLDELGDSVRGKRVVLPRAERGTPALAAGLTSAGAIVEELVLYRTVTPGAADPRSLQALRDGLVDVILFASGSAVRGFVRLAGAAGASRSAVACLGPSAAEAARAASIVPDWEGGGEGLTELCEGAALALARRSDYSPRR
jgi:uroporphyrinogen-III synthase